MVMGTALLVVLGILGLIVIWFIATYNRFVGMRNRVRNAWSQIDVQLRRRYDLIPNLVETAKGYLKRCSTLSETDTGKRRWL